MTTTPNTVIPTNPTPTKVLAPIFFVPPPLVAVAVELLPLILAGEGGANIALGLELVVFGHDLGEFDNQIAP